MRIRLNLQQAEILSDAANNHTTKLLSEDQQLALNEVQLLLKNSIKSEIDLNDIKFESMIETLVDQGKYDGVKDTLNNIHNKIKDQNTLRKSKYK